MNFVLQQAERKVEVSVATYLRVPEALHQAGTCSMATGNLWFEYPTVYCVVAWFTTVPTVIRHFHCRYLHAIQGMRGKRLDPMDTQCASNCFFQSVDCAFTKSSNIGAQQGAFKDTTRFST
jgi:hypothetical protein